MTEWILLGCVVLLIAANALFVSAEFALITVDRPSVKRAAEGGDRRAQSLQVALRSMSTQLSGAQLGITVSSLIIGYIAEPSIATLLRQGPLSGLDDGVAMGVSVAAAFVLATVSQMVLGELVPKNWAISEPLRLGKLVAGPQRGFTWATKPLLVVLNGTANAIVRLVGLEPQEELASARSAQELSAMARLSAREGTLAPALAARVERSATLGERFATDAMTPRPRVQFVSADDPAQRVLELSEATGHSRFPVMAASDGEHNVDDIVGAVHFKHALAVPAADRGRTPVSQIAVGIGAVPSAMALDDVLNELRGGLQMAVVVDEYGGTDGIVTLEDLVEELIGEIEDEHDVAVARSRDLGDGRQIFSGLVRPDEVPGLSLPEPDNTETLGGLVTEQLGRFPLVGDVVEVLARDTDHLDKDGIAPPVTVALTVTRLDGRRVDRISLRVRPPTDATSRSGARHE